MSFNRNWTPVFGANIMDWRDDDAVDDEKAGDQFGKKKKLIYFIFYSL